MPRLPSDRSWMPRIVRLAGFAAGLAAVFAICVVPAARAQSDYPNHPITLLVGYSAGGSTDVLARVLGGDMGKTLGQPIVVDDRVGANGDIATQLPWRSPPTATR